MKIFDTDTLMELFEEMTAREDEYSGPDFDEWVVESGYTNEWTDEMIYKKLPQMIKDNTLDLVMNASWWHEGL